MTAAYLSTSDEAASGAARAGAIVEAITSGKVQSESAWLEFIEITAAYGRHSQAARAFVKALAERAAS